MLRRKVLAWLPMGAIVAGQQLPPPPRPAEASPEGDIHLPNGKLQRDEILKSDYEKTLQDAADLQRLSKELQLDLEKASAFVVSYQTIKKTEEIEKIARRIRGRLKHS